MVGPRRPGPAHRSRATLAREKLWRNLARCDSEANVTQDPETGRILGEGALRFLDGRPWKPIDGWSHVQELMASSRHATALCGIHDGVVRGVALGTIDGDPGIQLQRHIHVASKAPWDHIGGDAPQFPAEPE
jgi:hypothetical protein